MSRVARHARIALLAVGLAGVLAACGGGNTATSGPPASLPAGTVVIEARSYAFTPSTLSVPAGDVAFRISNTSAEEHEFEILQGEALIAEVKGIAGGQSKDLSATLAAGEYQFKCLLNGHDQLGMTGTLTVTAS